VQQPPAHILESVCATQLKRSDAQEETESYVEALAVHPRVAMSAHTIDPRKVEFTALIHTQMHNKALPLSS
jgi:hypothetical protein